MDCREHRELNPKSCIFVKQCKPGFTRNDKFICRKTQRQGQGTKRQGQGTKRQGQGTKKPSKYEVPNEVPTEVPNQSKTRKRPPKPSKKDFIYENQHTNVKYQINPIKVPNAPSHMDLNYDDKVLFLINMTIDDAPPGFADHEYISSDKERFYEPLRQIPHWRRRLSTFWVQPFYLDGHLWASVEHFIQASKFKKRRELYLSFSLDSGSELSKNSRLAKETGEKIDPDDFIDINNAVYKAQYAKFSQNNDLKHLLRQTGNAKLMYFSNGQLTLFDKLIYIRENLK